MKKIVSILTIFIILFSNIMTVTAQNCNITVLGTDTITKGNWTQSYGKSGYMIFYGDTLETSGRNNSAKHITALPEYADVNNTTPGFSYSVIGNPSEDERALLMPSGEDYVRRAVAPYNYNRNAFKVKISDNQEHIVSFYVTSFTSAMSTVYYQVTDADGKIIDKQNFDRSQGMYISVCADCDFNFEIGSYDQGVSLGVNAVFFDEPLENTISDYSVQDGNEPRSVNISWNSENAVNIYRKTQDDMFYKLIAENISENTFLVKNLDPGNTYSYQLREKRGMLYSDMIQTEYATKSYDKLNMTLESDNIIRFENLEDTVTAKVKVTDTTGEGVGNIDISAVLDADFSYLDEDEKILTISSTNDNGIAQFQLSAEYYGEYKIKFITEYDDERQYDECEVSIDVSFPAGEHKSVPYLRKISEEIEPEEVFNIYGEGIKGDNVEIKAYLADGNAKTTPPAGAYTLEVLQKDMSEYGFYVSTRLPENALPGVYDVWVKNEYGWSEPIKLNGAEVLFTDEYEIYSGLDVRIMGRNFDGTYFSKENNPSVRLVSNTGNTYDAQILESNRVMIRFTVDGSVPAGTYSVEVNNTSANTWEGIKSGQTITILDSHSDPLGLGVPWTNKFNWVNYDAEQFGIIADTGEDLSKKIDDATRTIESLGGGVLNFGEGEYCISYIELRNRVVLNGSGKDKTIFSKLGRDDNRFAMRTSDTAKVSGTTGVSNLTLYAENDSVIPTQSWIFLQGNDETCSNLFVYDTDIKISDNCTIYRDAISLSNIYERLFIGNCDMAGIPTSGYVRYYGKYINNNFQFTESTPALFSQYSTIINNTAINPQVAQGNVNTAKDIHGFSIKGNTYFAQNEVILGLHPQKEGAGEVVMLEPPNTVYACGKVVNAKDNTVRIYGHEHMVTNGEIVLPKPIYGELFIAIAGGRGMGQCRKVIGYTGKDTLIIDKNWDICPDSTSTYTLMVAFENTTIYKNKAAKCEANIAFYSNCFNCIAVENELDTTGGIAVNAFHIEGSERIAPVYNVRIEDNIMTNHIDHDDWKGISATGQLGGDDVQFIGIEIKNNTISNSENHPLYQGETGTRIRLSASSVGNEYNGLGTIIDGNTYIGFETPILFENASGIIVKDNKFVDCGVTFITTNNTSNVLYLGERAETVYFTDEQNYANSEVDFTYYRTNLINETKQNVIGKLIFAIYNSDTELAYIYIVEDDVKIASNSTMESDIVITDTEFVQMVKSGLNVKAFYWDGFQNLTPIAGEAAIIQ